jgi:hypothetical protein
MDGNCPELFRQNLSYSAISRAKAIPASTQHAASGLHLNVLNLEGNWPFRDSLPHVMLRGSEYFAQDACDIVSRARTLDSCQSTNKMVLGGFYFRHMGCHRDAALSPSVQHVHPL